MRARLENSKLKGQHEHRTAGQEDIRLIIMAVGSKGSKLKA
jgi:hypothetical protein